MQIVQQWVAARNGQVEFRRLNTDTATVALAAEALGVPEEQVMKSLVFLAGDKPYLIIGNGRHRVDDRKLAAHAGVSRNKVRMATADEALEITGFAPGVMPPFAHKRPLPTLLDTRAAAQPYLWGGTGDEAVLLGLAPAELIRLTGAAVEEMMK